MIKDCYTEITLRAKTPEQKSEINNVLVYFYNYKGLFNQLLPIDVKAGEGDVCAARKAKWGTPTDINVHDCNTEVVLSGITKDEDENEYQFDDGEVSVKLTFNTYWNPCFDVVEELYDRGLSVYALFEWIHEGRKHKCVYQD